MFSYRKEHPQFNHPHFNYESRFLLLPPWDGQADLVKEAFFSGKPIVFTDLTNGGSALFCLSEYEDENETFENEVFNGHGYFSVIVSGESSDWKQVKALIDEEIEKVKANGINKEEFEIIKKSMYGEQIRGFASVSGVAEAMLATDFEGLSVYEETEVLANITVEDIMNRLAEFDINNTSVSIINPDK